MRKIIIETCDFCGMTLNEYFGNVEHYEKVCTVCKENICTDCGTETSTGFVCPDCFMDCNQ
ncbi:MAG: hypothetical protein ACXACC_11000 [Promethearchaeota archaeon]|jgi:hypothetical protein